MQKIMCVSGRCICGLPPPARTAQGSAGAAHVQDVRYTKDNVCQRTMHLRVASTRKDGAGAAKARYTLFSERKDVRDLLCSIDEE